MFATVTKIDLKLACSLLLLGLLSACAGRGGVVTDDSAVVADAELRPQAVADNASASHPTERPTLFKSPYLVKGSGDHELKAKWTAQVDGDDQLLLNFRPVLSETLACAAGRGAVYCFDRTTGKRVWKHKVRDLASGVSLSSELALLGTDEGEVVALNLADGTEAWRATVGGEVLALVAAGKSQTGEVLVAYSSAGHLTGLRASNGETVWVQEQKVPRLTLRGLASPIVVDDLVIAGHDNGKITANTLIDGSGVWSEELLIPSGRNELERLADIDGAIAYYRGDVFAASWGGKLGAWSAKRGRALWRADIASVTGVAADLRQVYVTDTNNALHAIDARSGRILWKRDDLVPASEKDDRRVIATTTLDGSPLVLDNLGRLYFYGRATGELDFATTIAGEYAAAPAIDGDNVLTLSRGGLLNLWQLKEAK